MWKRIVGGLIGLGVLVGGVLYFKSQGGTGDEAQEWQGIVVYSAAAAFVVVALLNRRGK